MRILLDQNVPRALARALTGHTVESAAEHGWEELVNGRLLSAAVEAGFELLVTADKNMVHQQNMTDRRIAIAVLSTNHWPTMRGQLQIIAAAVDQVEPRGYVRIQCGRAPKRRRPPPR